MAKISDQEIKENSSHNKKILFIAIIATITVAPLVFLTREIIFRQLFFVSLAVFIYNFSRDHGKRFGKMSVRMGKGNFLPLAAVYYFCLANIGISFSNDQLSEYIYYKLRHKNNYSIQKDDMVVLISIYKTIGIFDYIVSRSIEANMNLIPNFGFQYIEGLKEKYIENQLNNVKKREFIFEIAEKRDKFVKIFTHESYGDYFVIRIKDRLIDSIMEPIYLLKDNLLFFSLYISIFSGVGYFYVRDYSRD